MMKLEIRDELPEDQQVIRQITEAAFKQSVHSSGTEGAIVDALRASGDLTLSLVAIHQAEVIGHLAVSPVTIADQKLGWFGLGPVSVRPDLHRQGVGTALIQTGLARLKELEALGIVVLGDPNYYHRFGFVPDSQLCFTGVPPEYFMRMLLAATAAPKGAVKYHPSFYAV